MTLLSDSNLCLTVCASGASSCKRTRPFETLQKRMNPDPLPPFLACSAHFQRAYGLFLPRSFERASCCASGGLSQGHPLRDSLQDSGYSSGMPFISFKEVNKVSYKPPLCPQFWKGLSLGQRRELLRVDKATLFETVRKNLYCCKCHGLLVEGFTQLLLYNRTLQNGQFENVAGPSNGEYLMNSPQGAGGFVFGAGGAAKVTDGGGIELVSGLVATEEHCKDPLIHPWGGLTATKDSVLTILDCFLRGDAPTVVFESSRIRERERELLYPDACGGFKGHGGNKVTVSGRKHGCLTWVHETHALFL
jgi:hypothetical protein